MAKKTTPKTPSRSATPESKPSVTTAQPGAARNVTGPSSLRSRVPVGNNADLSKGQKAGGLVKGAVDGAQGKNAAGLAAGGQLTGALAGAGQALVSQTKGRTLVVAWLLGTLAPFAGLLLAIVVISSLLSATLSQSQAGADQSVVTSTGLASGPLEQVQAAAQYHVTPWTVLEATIYYETGVGNAVAQQRGVCPPQSPSGAICPATLSLQPGSLTGGSGSSSQGTAPSGGATSGFDPTVGRNGVVPVLLASNAPDRTTTNTANWDCIRQAESGDNYTLTSGAYGILISSWASLGLPGTPGQASKALQDATALEILNYEGHFYGAWNDLCTKPGNGASGHIAYISPGVADPSNGSSGGGAGGGSGGATSVMGVGGVCLSDQPAAPAATAIISTTTTTTTRPVVKHQRPARKAAPTTTTKPTTTTTAVKTPAAKPAYLGPYCLSVNAGTATVLNDLGLSSALVATLLDATLANDGLGDSVNLSQGVTLSDTGVPVVDPASNSASRVHNDVMKALATLPIDKNSTTMDENIYELAVSWANGYAPISSSTCAAPSSGSSASGAGPMSVPGPGGSADLLSPTQVALASQIVALAKSDGAQQSTQVAVLAAALALSNLSITHGIFGDGQTSVSSSVARFVNANAKSTTAPDAQAALSEGGSPSDYAGWITGATQLLNASTSTVAACGGTVPTVAGGSPAARLAVAAAKTTVGAPYVWGGGGTGGASGSASAPPSQVGQPGFDCSGLVQYAFALAGVTLPRVAQDQYNYVVAHASLTTNVAMLQPGDLVFFSDGETGVNHVAIYLGDGNIIQAAQTGQDIGYTTLAVDMGLGFLGGGPAA
jgi:cell wall-associated NlpC family hydrolase